jgi:hypothetical protein
MSPPGFGRSSRAGAFKVVEVFALLRSMIGASPADLHGLL